MYLQNSQTHPQQWLQELLVVLQLEELQEELLVVLLLQRVRTTYFKPHLYIPYHYIVLYIYKNMYILRVHVSEHKNISAFLSWTSPLKNGGCPPKRWNEVKCFHVNIFSFKYLACHWNNTREVWYRSQPRQLSTQNPKSKHHPGENFRVGIKIAASSTSEALWNGKLDFSWSIATRKCHCQAE